MAEEQPSLHIDTDWKKQAQEEKRKLAEQQQKAREQRAQAPPGLVGVGPAGAVLGAPPAAAAAPGASAGAVGRSRGEREMPPASFANLVQSLMTQALFYLGELAPQGGAPTLNLDMAKHQIDTLTVLEQKTLNNLDDAEKRILDTALYELRMRFVSVASQYL